MFTLVVIIPCYIISIAIADIQVMAKYTGGYAGTIIMLIAPPVYIINVRRNMPGWRSSPHVSWFKSQAWAYLTLSFGIIFLVVITTNIII